MTSFFAKNWLLQLAIFIAALTIYNEKICYAEGFFSSGSNPSDIVAEDGGKETPPHPQAEAPTQIIVKDNNQTPTDRQTATQDNPQINSTDTNTTNTINSNNPQISEEYESNATIYSPQQLNQQQIFNTNRSFNSNSSSDHQAPIYDDDYLEEEIQSNIPLHRNLNIQNSVISPRYEELKKLAGDLKNNPSNNGKPNQLIEAEVEKILSKLNGGGATTDKKDIITKEELASLPPEYQDLIRKIVGSNDLSRKETFDPSLAKGGSVYRYTPGEKPLIKQTPSTNMLSNFFGPASTEKKNTTPSKGVRTLPSGAMTYSVNGKPNGTYFGNSKKRQSLSRDISQPSSLKDRASQTLAKVIGAIKRGLSSDETENSVLNRSLAGSHELDVVLPELTDQNVVALSENATSYWWQAILVALASVFLLAINSASIILFLKRFRKTQPEKKSNVIRFSRDPKPRPKKHVG